MMINTPLINSGKHVSYLIQLMSINLFLDGSVHLTMVRLVTLENKQPIIINSSDTLIEYLIIMNCFCIDEDVINTHVHRNS